MKLSLRNNLVLCIGLITGLFAASKSFAQSGPANLNISGGLFNPNGSAITSSSVNFKIDVYDKNATCLLYSEQHLAQNLSVTKGAFSLIVGAGTSQVNNLEGTTTFDLKLFENNGATGAFTGCAAGVTFGNTDSRVIRVSYDLGQGFVAMTPDVPITSAAYAMVANSLEGHAATDFILTNVNTSLSQASLENVFTTPNYTALTALLNGSSTQYVPSSPTATVNFNSQRLTGLAAPTAGSDATNRTYVDGDLGGKPFLTAGVGAGFGGGNTIVWDQVNNRWTTSATGSVGLVAAGQGLLGGNITASGTLSVDVGTAANQILQLNSLAELPAVDGSLLTNVNAQFLQARKLSPVLPTAGQVIGWNNTTSMWEPSTPTGGTITALTGDVAASGSGSVVATIQPNAVNSSAKINNVGIAVNRLLITDAGTGATVGYAVCALNQVMQWSAGGWVCTNVSAMLGSPGIATASAGDATHVAQVAIDAQGRVTSLTNVNIAFPVTSVAGRTGAVTLTAADIGGLGTAATLNVGTAANDIVQLNGSAQLPAVDGSLLTNVNVATAANVYVNGGNSFGSAATLGTKDSNSLSFLTNNTTAMIVTTTGNVGIGTTTPGYLLDIGTASTTRGVNITASGVGVNALYVNATAASGNGTAIYANLNSSSNNTSAILGVYSGSGNSSGVIGQATGSGVGVTGISANGWGVEGNSNTGVSGFFTSSNTGNSQPTLVTAQAGASTADLFQAQSSGGISLFKITSAGNVGVGTTTPQAGLDIATTGTLASALIVPRDTNGNRPSAPVNGMIRYNTSTANLEGYVNGGWQAIAGAGGGLSTAGGTMTGQLVGEDGTAAAPSYTFAGDAGTGFYQDSSHVVGLSTNGVEAMKFSATGITGTGALTIAAGGTNQPLTLSGSGSGGVLLTPNVGIGTSTPLAELDVEGSGSVIFNVGNVGIGTTSPTSKLYVYGGSSGQALPGLASGAVVIESSGNGTNSVFQVMTAAGYGLTEQANGQVGIGMLSPSQMLEVSSANTNGTTLQLDNHDVGGLDYQIRSTGSAWSGGAGNLAIGVPGFTRMLINSTGLVGIGTTSPLSLLSVTGGGVAIGTYANTVAAPGQGLILSGNIGVGTPSPSMAVHISSSSTSGPGLRIDSTDVGGQNAQIKSTASGDSGGAGLLRFDMPAGSPRMSVTSTGLVGIGTTSPLSLVSVTGGGVAIGTYASSVAAPGQGLILSGNIGVGTPSPSMAVHISSSSVSGPGLRIDSTDVGGQNAQIKSTASGDIGGAGLLRFDMPAGTARISITSTGLVGVGTTSPLSAMSVAGGMAVGGTYAGTYGVSGGNVIIAGNVGVGTPSPQTTMHLLSATTSGPVLRLESTDVGGVAANIMSTGSANTGGAGLLRFDMPAGTGRMFLNTSGQVGIGTSSPQAGLDISTTGALSSAIIVPRDSQANRPSTPVNGMIRYNTSASTFEGFANGAWGSLAAGSGGLNTTGGTMTGELISADGSAATPGIGFAGDTNTGLYDVSAGTIGVSVAGTQKYAITAGSIAATTTGGALITSGNGTAAAPAFSFTGDAGTGWFRPAAGMLAASTVGTERVRIDNIGNVGIGTSTPGAALNVAGTSDEVQTLIVANSTQTNDVLDVKTSSGVKLFSVDPFGNVFANLQLSVGTSGTFGLATAQAPILSANGSHGFVAWSTTGNAFNVAANMTDQSGAGAIPNRVAASIGTSTFGSTNPETIANAVNFYVAGPPTAGANTTITNPLALQVASGTSVFGGNVGIGTTTPAATLEVNGNGLIDGHLNTGYVVASSIPVLSASQGVLGGNSIQGAMLWGWGSTYDAVFNNHVGGSYLMVPTGTTNVLLSPLGGSVGIGTAIPQAALDIAVTGTMSGLLVPRDTLANRPAGINGMIRYNTSNSTFEGFANGGWGSLAAGFGGLSTTGGTMTGELISADGTAATPGIGFAGDTNTGLYDVSAGSIGVTVAGTQKYAITAGSIASTTTGGALITSGNGTAAAPAFSFTGDAGTGWFRPAAGMLAASTLGTERMRVDNAGNVGIGTPSPVGTLDVEGGQAAANTDGSSIKLAAQGGGSGSQAGGLIILAPGGGTGGFSATIGEVILRDYNHSTTAPQLTGADSSNIAVWSLGQGSVGGNVYLNNSTSSGDLILSTGGAYTDRIHIAHSGNVGIGTTSPGYPLDIEANSTSLPSLNSSNLASALYVPGMQSLAPNLTAGQQIYDIIGQSASTANSGGWDFVFNASGAGHQNRLEAGFFGIGYKGIEIMENNGNPPVVGISMGASSVIGSNLSVNGNASIGNGFAGTGAPANGMIVQGNVGIGTTTPNYTLEVAGVVNVPSSGGAGGYISTGNMGGTGNAAYFPQGLFANGSTNWLYGITYIGSDLMANTGEWRISHDSTVYFNTGGYVGIGTTSPQAILDITGTGTMSAMLVPRDTQANRPTGVNGMIRYNTSTSAFEGYSNGGWSSLAAGSGGLSTTGGTMTGELISADGSAAAPGIGFVGDTNTGFYDVSAGTIGVTVAGAQKYAITAGSIASTTTGGALITSGNGTAAAPAFSFTGDTGTGWFRPAAGMLAASTVGTEHVRIDNFGNVGIGTTSPSTALSVVGDATISGRISGSGGNPSGGFAMAVGTGAIASGNNSLALGSSATASNSSAIAIGSSTVANAVWSTAIGVGAQATAIGAVSLGNTTTASGFTSLATGYNTSAPSYGEFVAGSYNVTGGETGGSWVATDPIFVIGNGSSVGSKSNAITVLKNGNVGIGTTTPQYPLDVAGAIQAFSVYTPSIISSSGLTLTNTTATSGNGGNLTGTGGLSTSNAGGALALYGGNGSTGGGNATVGSGSAFSNGNGGTLTLYSGAGAGGGNGGNILILPGAGTLPGNVGIGTLSPQAGLDIATTGTASSAVIVPRDTQANRPTGVNGMIRYNTNSAAFEGFSNGAWGSLAGGGGLSTSGGTMTGQLISEDGTAAAPGIGFTGDTNTGLYDVSAGTIGVSVAGTQKYAITAGSIASTTTGGALITSGNGTAAAPAFSFTGDAGTGWFRPAAGMLAASTVGTEHVRIDNFGNVGIGTSSPQSLLSLSANPILQTPNANSLLQVTGADNSSVAMTFDAFGNTNWMTNYLTFRRAHGTSGAPALPQTTDTLAYLQFEGWTAPNTYNANSSINVSATENWTGSAFGTQMQFTVGATGSAAGVMPLKMSSSGVYVFSPNALANSQLEIGAFRTAPSWTTTGSSLAVDSYGTASDTTGSGTIALRVLDSFGASTLSSSSAETLTNAATVYIGGAPAAGANTTITNGEALYVAGGNSYFGGNVGIGIAAPPDKLDVYGVPANAALPFQEIIADTTAWGINDGGGIGFSGLSGSAGFQQIWSGIKGGKESAADGSGLGYLAFQTRNGTSTTEWMRIGSAGNVGIGTTTPQAALDIAVTGTMSGMLVPRDTLANRPTGVNGMIRYNTNSATFEGFANGAWGSLAGGGGLSASGGTMTGQLISEDGSAGTPGIGFTGDTNTGFYDVSAGTIGVSIAGTQKYAVTAGSIASTTTGGALITSGNGTAAAPAFSFTGDTGTGWFRPAAGMLAASTLGTERMRIDNSGYVGIGTTSPLGPFDVRAPAGVLAGEVLRNNDFVNGSTGSALGIGLTASSGNVGGYIQSYMTGANSYGSLLLNPGGGSVGIGTVGPNFQLEIAQGGGGLGNQLSLTSTHAAATGTGPTLNFQGDTNGVINMGYMASMWDASASGADMVFDTRTHSSTVTEKMRITGTGNVGIGTTSPQGTLDVEGGRAAASDNGTDIILAAQSAGIGGTSANGGDVLLLPGASANGGLPGYVGVNTETPGFILDVENTDSSSAVTNGDYDYPMVNANLLWSPTTNAVSSNYSRQAVFGGVWVPATNTHKIDSIIGINAYSEIDSNSIAGYRAFGSESIVALEGSGDSMTSLFGSDSQMDLDGASTATNGYGGRHSAWQTNGVLTNSYGSYALNTQSGGTATDTAALLAQTAMSAGTTGNLSGVEIKANFTGGSVTNRYGILLNTQSGTPSGQDYAIYSLATQKSYLAGNLGIGTTVPQAALDVAVTGTMSAMIVPRDTLANRPTGVNGMIRYNTNSAAFEGYGNGAWGPLASGLSTGGGTMTGQLVSEDGTAGAPGIGFNGDTNTGFYDVSAGTIGVTVAGTQKYAVTAASIASTTTGGALITSGNGTAAAPAFSFTGDTGTGWFRPSAGMLAASTLGTERMRMDNAGNVGIGTNAPTSPLQVSQLYSGTSGSFVLDTNSLNFAPAATSNSQPTALFNNVVLNGTANISSAVVAGLQTQVYNQNTNAAGGGYLYGNVGTVQHAANKPLNTGSGSGGEFDNLGTGTVSTAYGTSGVITNQSTGTVSSAYGLYSSITKTGGAITNSYGLYVDALAGTNKWGVYQADSTAQNAFAGNVGIGTPTPRATLELNGNLIRTSAYNANNNLANYDIGVWSIGAGATIYSYGSICSGNSLSNCTGSTGVVIGANNTSATVNIPNSGTTFFNGGNVGIGTTTPGALLAVSANTAALPAPTAGTQVQVAGVDGTNPLVEIEAFASNGIFELRRADTTAAIPSAVQSGETLGALGFAGYGASAYDANSAKILSVAQETFTNSTHAANLEFFTAATSSTVAERMRIDQNGNVGVGTTTPQYPLQVNGTANATTFLMNGSSSTEAAKITNAAEAVAVSGTAATGTVNFYVASGAVQYYTANATANWTLNWAWSAGTAMNTAMSVNDSVTTVFMVTQGATPYYPTAFQIDGASVTPKWQGGTAPSSGDASSIDAYTCTIIKTANATYTVLCAATLYK